MARKRYPFESKGFRQDGHDLWRRLTGRGMVVREGTLSVMRRFELADGNGVGFGGVDLVIMPLGNKYYELRFAEDPQVVQGYIHSDRTINRIKKGERAGIQVDPETLWVRKIWPLDRDLKWFQF